MGSINQVPQRSRQTDRQTAAWILWQRCVSLLFPSLLCSLRMSSPQCQAFQDRITQHWIFTTFRQPHSTVRAELMEGSTLTRRRSARCTTCVSLSLQAATRSSPSSAPTEPCSTRRSWPATPGSTWTAPPTPLRMTPLPSTFWMLRGPSSLLVWNLMIQLETFLGDSEMRTTSVQFHEYKTSKFPNTHINASVALIKTSLDKTRL